MVRALIPGLQREHIDKICKWVQLDNIKFHGVDDHHHPNTSATAAKSDLGVEELKSP